MKITLKNFDMQYLIYNTFEYILAFCLVANCRSMWLMIDGSKFAKYLFYLTACSLFACIFTNKYFIINRFKLGLLISFGIMIYFSVYAMLNNYNIKEFLKFTIIVILLIVYYFSTSNIKSIPDILKKYNDIILIIALVSTFFWLFGSILHVISPTEIVYSKWTNSGKFKAVYSYYGIYFEPQKINFFGIFKNLIRNSACFTEAPMASFNFSLALINEILIFKSRNLKRILLFVIANITTFSTTGYIIVITVFIYTIIRRKSKYIDTQKLKILFSPFLLGIGILLIYIMFKKKLSNSSGIIRLDDFIVGFKAWKNNIIIGNGFENNDILKIYMGAWRSYNTGFSNSPMQILAHCGLYIGIIYIILFCLAVKNAIEIHNLDFFIYVVMFELIAMYAEPRYVNNREWVKNKFLPKSDGIMHV